MDQALAGQAPYDIEFRMCRADGSERWVVARGTVLRDGTGRPTRMIGIDFDITDRKRAELALAESKARLKLFIGRAPVAIAMFDTQMRYLTVSQRFLTDYGPPGMTDTAQMVGLSPYDHFPEVPERWREVHRRVLAGETLSAERDTFSRADGRTDWVRWEMTPWRRQDGTVGGALLFAEVITNRVETEQALAESERRLREMADHAPVMIWVNGPDGGCRFVNEAHLRFFGAALEEVLGFGWSAAVHPDDKEHYVQAWLGAVAARAPFERDARLRNATGEYRWTRSRGMPRFAQDGAYLGHVGITIDLHEQRSAEEALRESEEWLRLAQEAGAIGIWEWDLDSGALRWSAREFTLHGLDPDTATASREAWRRAVHPEDVPQVEAEIDRAIRGGGEFRTEYRVVMPDGETRWLTGRGLLINGRRGGRRLLGVNLDITDNKTLEATLARANAELEARVTERTRALSDAADELRIEIRRREEIQSALVQAQKLEALGQLTGSVAHDFNNVLAAVMGSLRLIERRVGADKDIRRLIEGGEQAAKRAVTLIRQLMAFVRREDLLPVVVSPAYLLEEVDQMLRRAVGSGIALSIEANPEVWPVLTDPHRLEVALLNLAMNARDAMAGTGNLAITAYNVASGHDADRPHGLERTHDYVVVSVQDHGPGMTPEVLARATEPFFTTKPRDQGTGLGLAMVHGFARQSSGALRLLSTPGEGTTAEIWLPRSARDIAAPTSPLAEPDPALHGSATILVVDDDDQVRLVTATYLRDVGYEVIEASSVASAMVQTSAAARLDLVIADVIMPGGGGPDLAMRLRATRPGVPMLFVSGFGDPKLLAGEVVIAKPFSPGELSHRVLAALGRLPTSIHEKMLMRLSRPELRRAYTTWRALRDAAGSSGLPKLEALDIAGQNGAEHAYTVVLEDEDEDEPRFRFIQVGAALAQRLGRTLEGETAGGELEADEVFGGLSDAYHRCALHGVPCHDYARFGFGDGGEPLYFERLLLPVAADGGAKPTHLIGLAFFSDPV